MSRIRKKISQRILILTSFTLPETAGSGIHALRLANYLNRKGERAVILTFDRNLNLKIREVIDKTTVYRIPYFNKNDLFKLFSLPIIVAFYVFFVSVNNTIVIYGGKIIAFEIAILLGKFLRKKIIFRSLLYGIDDLKTLIKNRKLCLRIFYKKVFSKINYYSINRLFYNEYKSIFQDDKYIANFPQGVDLSIFYACDTRVKSMIRSSLKLPENIPVIVTAGFTIKRKGIDDIIDALGKITLPFLFVIIADHHFGSSHFLRQHRSESFDLLEKASKCLNNKFLLRDFDLSVDRYFKCSDILIHNAENEIPNVVYEAMACGMAVITKNNAGISQDILIHGQNCLLTDSTYMLAPAISTLLQDETLRINLGKNAYETIQRRADFNLIYEHLLK